MSDQATETFQRMSRAIEFINEYYSSQPTLKDVAQHVNMSEFHFQRMFTDWTGVSPKKFLQHLCLFHAKNRLRERGQSLLSASLDLGFSGPSRLHDLFVTIEAMTPGEFKNGGVDLSFEYEFAETPLGLILICSTPKGLTHLSFVEDQDHALEEFRSEFPKATVSQRTNPNHEAAKRFFLGDWSNLRETRLHLRASPFQIKIWQCLLRIPVAETASYGGIAKAIGSPDGSRAVGSAVGANPIAYLIPCHRVITSRGDLGGYRWGETRKKTLLAWDASAEDGGDSK